MQRSLKTCTNLTRVESILHDQIEDFQAEKLELMTKYPTVAERKTRMAQLDSEIGVIHDRPDKLMKSTKARDAHVALLFNYYTKSMHEKGCCEPVTTSS
jgi:hypothetical protein